MDNFGVAFLLTALAGLATGIGSVIAFFAKDTNYRFLSISTGLSAGVMLYVSFIEIFPKSHQALCETCSDSTAYALATAGFFAGIILIGLIDLLIPSEQNPHETHSDSEIEELHHDRTKTPAHLLRTGIFTALAIGIHNFPEGLATFLSALHDPSLGVAIAVAIALHNIPEGISVSVPIYYATKSKKRAFLYSVLSGISEPIGALVAFGLIVWMGGDGSISPILMGTVFSAVAGIMVYISIDELLPASRTYGKGHDSIIGLVSGMLIMALSLVLMR